VKASSEVGGEAEDDRDVMWHRRDHTLVVAYGSLVLDEIMSTLFSRQLVSCMCCYETQKK
jgi:hypothetical protein